MDAAAWFRADPALARETAFRYGTLQAAYVMLAIRALGADIGVVSGFDARAVQAKFLAAPRWRSTSSAISAMATRPI